MICGTFSLLTSFLWSSSSPIQATSYSPTFDLSSQFSMITLFSWNPVHDLENGFQQNIMAIICLTSQRVAIYCSVFEDVCSDILFSVLYFFLSVERQI